MILTAEKSDIKVPTSWFSSACNSRYEVYWNNLSISSIIILHCLRANENCLGCIVFLNAFKNNSRNILKSLLQVVIIASNPMNIFECYFTEYFADPDSFHDQVGVLPYLHSSEGVPDSEDLFPELRPGANLLPVTLLLFCPCPLIGQFFPLLLGHSRTDLLHFLFLLFCSHVLGLDSAIDRVHGLRVAHHTGRNSLVDGIR